MYVDTVQQGAQFGNEQIQWGGEEQGSERKCVHGCCCNANRNVNTDDIIQHEIPLPFVHVTIAFDKHVNAKAERSEGK